jgi:EAL domain-containing protein (putative c-di-GMP-specific phosphodiesterase class I)
MDIVAEGVETEFEAVTMAKLGCTELQGYYFSKPLPADELVKFRGTYQAKRVMPMVTQLHPTSPRGIAG